MIAATPQPESPLEFHMSDLRHPLPRRKPAYEAPSIQVVRIDPVTELLQTTECNFEPGQCTNPCG